MKSILQTLNKYKYIIIAFLFYAILAYYYSLSFINSVANSIMILLILNSISKLKGYNIITKVLAWIFTFIITVFVCTDIFFHYEFDSGISFGVFSSIIETSLSESLSVMKAYLVPCLIILIVVFTINYLIIKSLSVSKLNGWYSLIAFFPVYAFFIAFAFYRNGDKNSIADNIKEQPIIGFHEYFSNTFPLLLPELVSSIAYYAEMSRLKEYTNTHRNLPEGYAKSTENKKKPTKIYLVLGESSCRDHYSLYGYRQKTTPFLDKLSQDPDSALTHYNGISAASLTRDAVRFALTFAVPKNHIKPFYENQSIIDMANEMNYETVWLSNQEKTGIFDSYIGCVVEQTKQSYFLEKTKNDPAGDDWNLMEKLPEFSTPHKQQFIVLHLQGSHENYNDRYSAEDTLIVNEDKMIEAYDRTVHHTDSFLAQLYDFVKNQGDDAIIYYISDHGENMDKQPFGHGQMRGVGQYKIPLLAINYKSDINTSKIIDKYIMKESGLVSSISSVSILAEIMGYDVSESTINKTLYDSQFVYYVDSNIFDFKDLKD